jgi:hypothetical protein
VVFRTSLSDWSAFLNKRDACALPENINNSSFGEKQAGSTRGLGGIPMFRDVRQELPASNVTTFSEGLFEVKNRKLLRDECSLKASFM